MNLKMPHTHGFIFAVVVFWVLPCCRLPCFGQGISVQNSRRPIHLSKYQFGVQVVPFFIVPRVVTAGTVAVGDLLVSFTNFANANPSLQAGFFLNRQFNDRWPLRLDATLLHRSVKYRLEDNYWNVFTTGVSAPSAHTSATAYFRLLRRLHVGGGIGAQFHFVSHIPPISNPDFRDAVYALSNHSVRPVTLHYQWGAIWKFTKWNFGFMTQQSLNSFTTPFALNGQEYDLVQLHTRIYTLNLGYVLAPPKRPRKRE
jgi:hypothetical protein